MTPGAFEVSLAAFILVTAVGTAVLRDALSSIIVFGAYSLGMAVLYAFLLAPDVALTEAAIGAGVTTILLVVALSRTNRTDSVATLADIHWPALAVSAALVLALAWTFLEFPVVGTQEAIAWANDAVSQHYLAEAYAETGVENAVTAVLAGYRGFDTFGEAVVVFAVGAGVLLVLNREGYA